jgi:hypothetical protein
LEKAGIETDNSNVNNSLFISICIVT